MKKIIAAILVLASCIAVSGCNDGGNAGKADTTTVVTTEAVLTKDKMIATAETVSIQTLFEAMQNNIANAKKEYGGKILKVTDGVVCKIEEDHVTLFYQTESSVISPSKQTISVYLSIDNLATLKRNQKITVVGLISTGFEEATYDFSNNGHLEQVPIKVFKMENAYLVD